MTTYRIRFRARSIQPLPVDVAGRLTEAVAGTPSAESIEVAVSDFAASTVETTFVIDVATDKMVDAARDGSRLAKESLWSAGIDAKLIELNVLRAGEQCQRWRVARDLAATLAPCANALKLDHPQRL